MGHGRRLTRRSNFAGNVARLSPTALALLQRPQMSRPPSPAPLPQAPPPCPSCTPATWSCWAPARSCCPRWPPSCPPSGCTTSAWTTSRGAAGLAAWGGAGSKAQHRQQHPQSQAFRWSKWTKQIAEVDDRPPTCYDCSCRGGCRHLEYTVPAWCTNPPAPRSPLPPPCNCSSCTPHTPAGGLHACTGVVVSLLRPHPRAFPHTPRGMARRTSLHARLHATFSASRWQPYCVPCLPSGLDILCSSSHVSCIRMHALPFALSRLWLTNACPCPLPYFAPLRCSGSG